MGLLHRAYARSLADVWDTENRLLHTFSLVRRPVAAQWLVTAACDMKCPHCYSASGKRNPNELTTEEAKRLVIDPLAAMGCPLLVFAGGELLLRKDIPELVAYLRGLGMNWAMHTHGMHVPRFADLMRAHPPALAAISLDGDRSFHDAFRGREGSFDAALCAAELLADAGCEEVVFGTTITRGNADAVADLYPLVAASRADSWGLHLFAPEGRGHEHAELFPTPGQLRRVAAFARRRRAEFPIELCNEWGSAGDNDPYYRDQAFTCGAGRISLVISATGDVLPCTTTDPAEREGNVRETPLGELWQRGFGRFRSGDCGDRGECWLQSRNGVACAEDAFGSVARRPQLWVERLPSQLTLRRGNPMTIGPRGTMAVGLAAAGLVFLQGCVPKPAPTPAPGLVPKQEVPKTRRGNHWSKREIASDRGFPSVLGKNPAPQLDVLNHAPNWQEFREALKACEQGESDACGDAAKARAWDPQGAVSAYATALASEPGPSFSQALAFLDAVEQRPGFDATIVGLVWRSVRNRPVTDATTSHERARLYGRLRHHARVVDALIRGAAKAGPRMARPWLKKSMPAKGARVRRQYPPTYPITLAGRVYSSATATTWATLSLGLTVEVGSAQLARAGSVSELRRGERLELSRLDVLWCPDVVRFRTERGRVLTIPAGTEVTLFDLPNHLSDEDATEFAGWAERAAKGSADELDALQAELPLAHPAVRERSDAAPLKTLLVTFDE